MIHDSHSLFCPPRNNLGTVYNMMRDHEKAQEYFLAAQQVAGHAEPDKNDLWNMGIVHWREMVEVRVVKVADLG